MCLGSKEAVSSGSLFFFSLKVNSRLFAEFSMHLLGFMATPCLRPALLWCLPLRRECPVPCSLMCVCELGCTAWKVLCPNTNLCASLQHNSRISDIFEVDPIQMCVPSRSHAFATVTFTPQTMQSYQCTFEACLETQAR